MNKKTVSLLIALLLILAVMPGVSSVFACEPPPPTCPLTTELRAGQQWNAGEVEISNDGTNVYVNYSVSDGWSLGETHLYVGTEPPTKAAPGRFPYKKGNDASYPYVVPLSDFEIEPCGTLYIAAHAVVYNGQQEETAWADSYGIPIREGKGWAMYVEYPLCCDTPGY